MQKLVEQQGEKRRNIKFMNNKTTRNVWNIHATEYDAFKESHKSIDSDTEEWFLVYFERKKAV